MKTTRLLTLLVVLICTTTVWAQTWLGSGNSADPFILKSTNEWEALAKQVAEGRIELCRRFPIYFLHFSGITLICSILVSAEVERSAELKRLRR